MKLEQFRHINPAVVYTFGPEGSIKFPHPNTVAYLLHDSGQYRDMFKAYQYAEETILTFIEKNGISQITADQLLEWLDQIHSRIAATLAIDASTQAGKYTNEQLFRWKDSIIPIILTSYLADKLTTIGELNELLQKLDQGRIIKLLEKKSKVVVDMHSLILLTFKAIDMNEGVVNDFIKLLKRIRDDANIEIPNAQQFFINGDPIRIKGARTFLKLATVYHADRLSPEEKAAVDQVVTICLPPAQYPYAMKKFAKELVTQWQQCNPKDLNQVAKLVMMAITGIAGENHPYFNGNGRTARCIANVILFSLKKISILLTYPKERDDINSSYCRAIQHIAVQPDLLFEHIKARIVEAETCSYENKLLAATIVCWVTIGDLVLKIKDTFPNYPINSYYQDLMERLQKQLEEQDRNTEHFDLASLNNMLQSITTLFNQLSGQKGQSKESQTPNVIQRRYSQEEIHEMFATIKKITGCADWKVSSTNGLIFWCYMPNKEAAAHLTQVLNSTQALQAESRTTQQQKIIVSLSAINLDKLRAIQSLNGITISDTELSKQKQLQH